MVISPSTLDAAFLGFSTQFQQVFQDTPTRYQDLATSIPMATKELRNAFLNRIPAMRKWVGERQFHNLVAGLQAMVAEKYEDSIAVDREDIEDDTLGIYTPAVSELARQARQWPDTLVFTALEAGTGYTGYDGKAFFATDHPVDPSGNISGTAQSNYSASGKALSAANYNTVRSAMRSYKGADGKPLEINPDTLIVPPALEKTAREILEAEFLSVSSGSTQNNVLRGTAKVLVAPKLTSDTRWYLADTSRAIKPLVFGQRMAPEFVTLTNPSDPNVFLQDRFLMGVRARGVASYGPWFLIYSANA